MPPVTEPEAQVAAVEAPLVQDQGVGQRERHRGVVGPLPGFQPEGVMLPADLEGLVVEALPHRAVF